MFGRGVSAPWMVAQEKMAENRVVLSRVVMSDFMVAGTFMGTAEGNTDDGNREEDCRLFTFVAIHRASLTGSPDALLFLVLVGGAILSSNILM